jgi:hypothetical protein
MALLEKETKIFVKETSLRNSTWMIDEKHNRTKLEIS